MHVYFLYDLKYDADDIQKRLPKGPPNLIKDCQGILSLLTSILRCRLGGVISKANGDENFSYNVRIDKISFVGRRN